MADIGSHFQEAKGRQAPGPLGSWDLPSPTICRLTSWRPSSSTWRRPSMTSSRGRVWSHPTLASWTSTYSVNLRSCLPHRPPSSLLPPKEAACSSFIAVADTETWGGGGVSTAHALTPCWHRCSPTPQSQSAGAAGPKATSCKKWDRKAARPQEQLKFSFLNLSTFYTCAVLAK